MGGRCVPFVYVLIALLWASVACAGVASWYGEEHRGRRMANGDRFDPDRLTCASWRFPLGSVVRVSVAGRHVDVVVTDRGPARRLRREIDLSRAAFAIIGDPRGGLIDVDVRLLTRSSK